MRSRSPFALLAASAILFAGLTNAHVHLCFDGQEPPAAVHLPDHSHHLDHGHGLKHAADHDDLDVDMSSTVLSKTFKHDLPATQPSAEWALSLNRTASISYAPPAQSSPRPPPPFLRPLLRAPPL